MTRDEIISMAWEVGFIEKWQECKGGIEIVKVTDIDKLERFAALVAASKIEKCAKVCDLIYEKSKIVGKTDTYMGEYASEFDAGFGSASCECADAIRAMEKK